MMMMDYNSNRFEIAIEYELPLYMTGGEIIQTCETCINHMKNREKEKKRNYM